MNNGMSDYGIQFIVPLSRPCQIDANGIVHNFRRQWRIKTTCTENPEWGDAERGTKVYVMRNEFNNMLLTYYNEQFSPEMVNLALSHPEFSGNLKLDEVQKKTLKENKAFIVADYKMGPPDAKKRVYFSAQVLITLLELESAIGYFNRSAQMYRAKEHLKPFFQQRILDPGDLFILFGNIQLAVDKGRYWAHTHGLDQFDIPDIQVFTDEGDSIKYYWSLIGDAALYCIDNGPILKVNDTCELMGDGIIFRIKAAKEDPNHPFGRCGAIELTKER